MPETYNNLWTEITDFGNLDRALHLAARGRRFGDEVARFLVNRERELLRLQGELLQGSYRPGPTRSFWILEKKRRLITAPAFRDRVVHHALCRVVMPLFERKMIHDSYANRSGKGTHQAIHRAQQFCRSFPYVLKCDIVKYFPSIDHVLLKKTFRRTIRCPRTLWLMNLIVDSSAGQVPVCTWFPGDDLVQAAERRVGIPIGNLTSQWFANLFLTDFDHWVKEQLDCRGFVRYVDDFLLFANEKARLWAWRTALDDRLAAQRLRLHPNKSTVMRTADGVTFLGQRIWPHKRRLCRDNVVRARRRLRGLIVAMKAGKVTWEAANRRWASWLGHARQADSSGLVQGMVAEARTSLSSAPEPEGVSA